MERSRVQETLNVQSAMQWVSPMSESSPQIDLGKQRSGGEIAQEDEMKTVDCLFGWLQVVCLNEYEGFYPVGCTGG